jgi:hypothetical protein
MPLPMAESAAGERVAVMCQPLFTSYVLLLLLFTPVILSDTLFIPETQYNHEHNPVQAGARAPLLL